LYDEILDWRLKKQEYGKLGQGTFNDDRVRKKEQQIMEVILKHEDGIAHGELALIVGIDRKNLTHYIKSLMDKGLVTRGNGAHGLYFPTTKARRAISLTADILANTFKSRILENDSFLPDIPSPNKDLGFSDLEYKILKMSNTLGGFITYALIQSMNPENKITEYSRNDEEKDIAVQAWLEDTMSIVLENILFRFKELIYNHLKTIDYDIPIPINASDSDALNIAGNIYQRFFHKRPYLTLNEKVISELTASFLKVYPNLGSSLKKIRSDVPKLLEEEINHIRHTEAKIKIQKKCEHNFQEPLNQLYESGRFRHCRKCHKTELIKKKIKVKA
jgi:DNA-binding MarR family transcriptional regulator